MATINFPLTPLQLETTLKAICSELNSMKVKILSFEMLNNFVKNVNNGSSITTVLSASEFEDLFNSISNKHTLKITSSNVLIFPLSASVEQIASDDFKSIELSYFYNGIITTLVFSKFGSDVFLDNKVNKTV